MSGFLITLGVVLLVLMFVGAWYYETLDTLLLVWGIIALSIGVFFLNGWLFMLGVGNLGKNFGYADSCITAALLAAVFSTSAAIRWRSS